MASTSRYTLSVLALVAATCGGTAPAERAALGPQATAVGYEVVAAYPHDTRAYTQGLFFHDGHLYEGTGRYGTSWLRKVEPTTGEVLQQVSLPAEYFGEGIALLGGRIFQLTWLSQRGFIYTAADLALIGEFRIEGEGWGLTTDGTDLILSDGSDTLSYLDAATQRVVRTLRVREQGRSVHDLNELEYIGGLIYANVWHSDDVLKIDPRSGDLVGRIDFSGLLAGERPRDPEAVLNGIAYDPTSGHLYVTGKNWPKLFEVRLTSPDPQDR